MFSYFQQRTDVLPDSGVQYAASDGHVLSGVAHGLEQGDFSRALTPSTLAVHDFPELGVDTL